MTERRAQAPGFSHGVERVHAHPVHVSDTPPPYAGPNVEAHLPIEQERGPFGQVPPRLVSDLPTPGTSRCGRGSACQHHSGGLCRAPSRGPRARDHAGPCPPAHRDEPELRGVPADAVREGQVVEGTSRGAPPPSPAPLATDELVVRLYARRSPSLGHEASRLEPEGCLMGRYNKPSDRTRKRRRGAPTFVHTIPFGQHRGR